MTSLDVQDLRTVFDAPTGPVPVVDGVTFSLGRGETVGLVGESGCGKSITALSILGLVPSPGRITPGSSVRFEGQELVGLPPRRWTAVRGGGIGMVFQEPMTSLNPVRTVGDQVAEGLRLHGGLGRRAAWSRALDILGEVGFRDPGRRARQRPHELSGGMRQRVVIAAALACEPSVLLADEPTTALDVTIQAQVLELLDGLRARRNMALLLITHDLAVVAERCQRIMVMYAGQIVESGPTAEVLAQPRHPYTLGLLDALPATTRRAGGAPGRLQTIPGTVPRPGEAPEGCRFRPRCPRAVGACLEAPPLGSVSARRSSRCWLELEEAG